MSLVRAVMLGAFAGRSYESAHGSFVAYLSLPPVGLAMMLLAIRPTDVIAIRSVTAIIFGLCCLITGGMAFWLISGGFYIMPLGYFLAFGTGGVALMRPMMCSCCCGDTGIALSPRVALRHLWLGSRLLLVGYGTVTLAWPIEFGLSDDPGMAWALGMSIISYFVAAILTPANRGRAHRILGGLGNQGTKEAEAATISALIGGGDASFALAQAAKRFRALPLSALKEEDLASSSDTGLHAKTQLSKLGEVAGFVSHSWSDAGPAKYAQLHTWAAEERQGDPSLQKQDSDPLQWLDKAMRSPWAAEQPPSESSTQKRDSLSDPLLWLDKAVRIA